MIKFKYGQNINADRCIEYFRKNFFDHINNPEKYWIAGGAVRDFLLYGTVGFDTDFDIFTYFEKNMNDLILTLGTVHDSDRIIDTPNVLKTKTAIRKGGAKSDPFNREFLPKRSMDFVKNLFKSPEDLISNFDFTVTGFCVTRDSLVALDSAFFDLAARKLVVNKLNFPIASMRRVPKYIKKGFTPCQGTMLELAEACTKVPTDQIPELSKFYFD